MDELPANGAAEAAGSLDPTAVPRIYLNQDFRLLWLARTLGQTAANTAQAGSLIIVVAETGSGWLASLIVLAWVLPGALLSLVSGLVVDAIPKRLLLAIANAARAAICLVFVATGQGTTEIFVVVLGLSALGPFVGPAESALVPTLVHREGLTSANAFLNLLRYVAQAVGFALVAPLVARTAGVETLFVITGALWAAAAVYAGLIPAGRDHHEPAFPDEAARPRPGGLREARAFLIAHRDVWQAAVQLSLATGTLPLVAAMLPLYLTDALGQRVSDVPVVFLPGVLGLLLGLRLVSAIARRRDAAWLATVGLWGFAAALLSLAAIDALDEILQPVLGLGEADLGVISLTAKAQLAMLILFPAGFALSLVNVAANAVLNARVPWAMQGRIFSLQMLMAGVAAIPPLLVGGALTEVVDVRVVLGGIPVLLLIAWGWSQWGRPDAWLIVRRLRARRA